MTKSIVFFCVTFLLCSIASSQIIFESNIKWEKKRVQAKDSNVTPYLKVRLVNIGQEKVIMNNPFYSKAHSYPIFMSTAVHPLKCTDSILKTGYENNRMFEIKLDYDTGTMIVIPDGLKEGGEFELPLTNDLLDCYYQRNSDLTMEVDNVSKTIVLKPMEDWEFEYNISGFKQLGGIYKFNLAPFFEAYIGYNMDSSNTVTVGFK